MSKVCEKHRAELEDYIRSLPAPEGVTEEDKEIFIKYVLQSTVNAIEAHHEAISP